jgi:hypothetical protein
MVMTLGVRSAVVLCAVWALAGCAKGYEGPEVFETGLSAGAGSGSSGTTGGGSGSGTSGTSGGAGMNGSAGEAAPSGEPCAMGASESCSCSSGGMGTRICRYDASSPTGGYFSECQQCTMPSTGGSGGSAGDGDVGSAGSRAGSGGSGGSAGRGGSGGSSGGAGTSGGSAGSSGGSAGMGGSEQPWCVFVPVPLPGLCR